MRFVIFLIRKESFSILEELQLENNLTTIKKYCIDKTQFRYNTVNCGFFWFLNFFTRRHPQSTVVYPVVRSFSFGKFCKNQSSYLSLEFRDENRSIFAELYLMYSHLFFPKNSFLDQIFHHLFVFVIAFEFQFFMYVFMKYFLQRSLREE